MEEDRARRCVDISSVWLVKKAMYDASADAERSASASESEDVSMSVDAERWNGDEEV